MSGIIVSYDGTPNDDDALALGRLLSRAGAPLALAYVRHSREYDPRREELAQHDAERRLDSGATWLADPSIPRHVVVSPSTGVGLGQLAEEQAASLVVFGSDYRTSPGRVEPGPTAQGLLEGGGVAIAVAPAGMRTSADSPISSVGIGAGIEDPAAEQTARELAAALGAEFAGSDASGAGLIVVGSQAGAPEGRVTLGGSARHLLETVRVPVLVVPRGTAVHLGAA